MTKRSMVTTDPTERKEPKISASFGFIRPAGIGRFWVRRMMRSISSSYHMLIAPDAPAPAAMQMTAIIAVSRSTDPGAKIRPQAAVNTTKDMTLGLSRIA